LASSESPLNCTTNGLKLMHRLFPSGYHVNIARNHAWCYSRWAIALYFALIRNHMSPLYPPLV